MACWSRAGALLFERSLGAPTTDDPDARYFTPDGGSCESFCLAPDATEVIFGGEGGDFASFEVVVKPSQCRILNRLLQHQMQNLKSP